MVAALLVVGLEATFTTPELLLSVLARLAFYALLPAAAFAILLVALYLIVRVIRSAWKGGRQ